MTQDEAIEFLWRAKSMWVEDEDGLPKRGPDGRYLVNPNMDRMLYATTRVAVRMTEWNGKHPVEKNETRRDAPAGTRVLVTVVSRFGYVGIRDKRLTPPSHGCYARVLPDLLTDWSETP